MEVTPQQIEQTFRSKLWYHIVEHSAANNGITLLNSLPTFKIAEPNYEIKPFRNVITFISVLINAHVYVL